MQSSTEIAGRNIIITLPTKVIQLLCRKHDEAEESATLAWTCSELRGILFPLIPPKVMVYVAIRSLNKNIILLAKSKFGVRDLRRGLRYNGYLDDAFWSPPPYYYSDEFEWLPHTKSYGIVKVLYEERFDLYALLRR